MDYEESDKCSLFIDNKLFYGESSKELFYSWHADLPRPQNTNTHCILHTKKWKPEKQHYLQYLQDIKSK